MIVTVVRSLFVVAAIMCKGFVCFVALRHSLVGRSVNLPTLFPGQA